MGQKLTSLTAFKSWYDFKGNVSDDGLLDSLIDQSSADILAYLGRTTCLKTTYTEYLNGNGGVKIPLRQWPVLSVTSLSIDGTAQSPAVSPNIGYFADPYDGFPPGRMQYITLLGGGVFCKGLKNICAVYVGGYAVTDEAGTIPASGAAKITTAQEWGPWARDEGVTAAGIALTKVTGQPAAGEYSVADGVYTFNTADGGTAVLISYSFTPATLDRACRELVGERYAYRTRIGEKSHSFQGNVTSSFDNKGLTDFVREMIQPYKRMVPY